MFACPTSPLVRQQQRNPRTAGSEPTMLLSRPTGSQRMLGLVVRFLALGWLTWAGGSWDTALGSERRNSPVVQAVQGVKAAVVNIDGQKTVAGDLTLAEERRVHGMGTGLIIDERGYILTNYHVVEGVRSIQVSLADETQYLAKLVAHDDTTDLAVIRIQAGRDLTTAKIGTSSDLLEGEEVIAVGNPFGYAHSVTEGIISSLHRNVRVSETQEYLDLIQTDASINPGNSGGPLLNIDGEVVGINVAVRAGAHGIGFAIPIDKALAVASELLSIERLDKNWHGLYLETVGQASGVKVLDVAPGSPAEQAGIQAGDRIAKLGNQTIRNALDAERACLGRKTGEKLKVEALREQERKQLSLEIAALDRSMLERGDRIWQELGAKFKPVRGAEFKQKETDYSGGLLVAAVKRDGAAYRDGLRVGDVLVGLHVWETMSMDHVEYILKSSELPNTAVKYYIVRDGEPFYGRITVAASGNRSSQVARSAPSLISQ